MKIIFLDIDGVMNCQDAYHKGFCQYVKIPKEKRGDFRTDIYQSFYPPSKRLLNKLIEDFDAKIVISSTWRHSGLDFMKTIWELENMSGDIIDITPTMHMDGYTVPRGCEIESWLYKRDFWHINWSEEEQRNYIEKSGIENYIILDDDSDMLYGQRKHFVHVLPSPRNTSGFNDIYYKQAADILKKDVVEVNFYAK